MEYLDKNKKEITDGDTILFVHEDNVEPGGFNKRVSNVKLCFWSGIEKRYIPFSEAYEEGNINDGEVIYNSVNL